MPCPAGRGLRPRGRVQDRRCTELERPRPRPVGGSRGPASGGGEYPATGRGTERGVLQRRRLAWRPGVRSCPAVGTNLNQGFRTGAEVRPGGQGSGTQGHRPAALGGRQVGSRSLPRLRWATLGGWLQGASVSWGLAGPADCALLSRSPCSLLRVRGRTMCGPCTRFSPSLGHPQASLCSAVAVGHVTHPETSESRTGGSVGAELRPRATASAQPARLSRAGLAPVPGCVTLSRGGAGPEPVSAPTLPGPTPLL